MTSTVNASSGGVGSAAAQAGARMPGNVAAMRRDLGSQLAALRREAGLTQDGLAEKLGGYSRATISLAETGHHTARGFWEQCDQALGTGGVLATGADQIEMVRQAEEQAAAREAQEAREARALAALTEAQRCVLRAQVTAVQSCPQCGSEFTVLTTLIPRTQPEQGA